MVIWFLKIVLQLKCKEQKTWGRAILNDIVSEGLKTVETVQVAHLEY